MGTLDTLGRIANVALTVPETVSDTKRYAQQQRQARKKIINKDYAPGGAPPMRKISGRQALCDGVRARMDKEAAPAVGIGWDAAGRGALMAAGALGLGLGVRGAAQGVGAVYLKAKSERMWKELQRRNPRLRGNKRAREAFDLAVAYAPSLLRHPTAIGDFVARQLEFPMSSHEFIQQLATLEATVSKTESQGLPAQLGASAESAGKYTTSFLPES